MLQQIDTSAVTDNAADLTTAIGVAGGLLVAAFVAAKTFPFVLKWIGKLFKASSGGTGS